ncbi:FAD-binding oxidoreductase [Bengtsoniella intestinalis]|uniref:FAD-binding oxidoreductase n=1 Tax=Bengtsoniella intestinalis TaxID=3073143 RepID=UPI00391F751E
MDCIHTVSTEYQEFLKDESRTVGVAETISFPTSHNQVVDIVHWCAQNSQSVTIQGARTGVAAGAVPFGGHVMNFSKLSRVLGCEVVDDGFAFTVEPGLSLIELNKMIATKKFDTTGWDEDAIAAFHGFLDAPAQFYPPDPTESTCSVGGMVSCNASGARSFRYGSIRGHLLGLRVVLSDGEVVTLRRGETMAQGRTLTLQCESGKTITLDLPTYQMPHTKNASGYYMADDMDAVDLFIGADGTLGVITEVTIVTTPLPREIWGVSCFFANEEQAVDFVERVREHPDNRQYLAAVEYFDPFALAILRTQKQTGTAFKQLPEIPEHYNACVFCELHCDSPDTAQTALFALGDDMELAGGDSVNTWVARNEGDLHLLQFFRHAVPESVNMIIDARKKQEPIITKLGSDMSVPDSQLKAVFALYQTTLQAAGLEYAIWGHIGDNHLHVNILPRNADEFHKGKALFKLWAEKTTAMGGAVSAEHGVGKMKASFLEIMYGTKGIDQMRRLKSALDPENRLNQGNLFSQGGQS